MKSMPIIVEGLVAGLAATVVLSAITILKQTTGLMPELNPMAMMTDMAGASTPMAGWLMHFMPGTVVWGVLFALLQGKLAGGDAVAHG